ncbi:MAG: hypothetical protein ACK55Z_11520, partial [bacterium]
ATISPFATVILAHCQDMVVIPGDNAGAIVLAIHLMMLTTTMVDEDTATTPGTTPGQRAT